VRDLYKVLGIAATADDLRIKSAFRRRALTTHPDLNPGSDAAEERFRELIQAYQVLRDAEARAAYDAHLARRRSQARRRFVQSAAVMMATFVLTTGSAVLLAGLQGINVHSQTWQIATAWLTSVEVEPAAPGRQPVTEVAKGTQFVTAVVAATHATAPPPERSGRAAAERPRKVAAAPPSAPAAADAASPDEPWWPWQ
jgi:curved DNA-binding protein CbpA